MNSSVKKLINKKYLIAFFLLLPFLIFLFFHSKEESPVSQEIDLRSEKIDGKIRVEVQDSSPNELDQVDFYLDGELFFRGFESEVSTDSANLEEGVVSFIFDDGWLNVFTNAYPIFGEFQSPASVAIIKNYVDQPTALTMRQLRVLKNEGWGFLAHGVEDEPLVDLTPEEQSLALWSSKKFVWENLWAVSCFAFPFGSFNDQTLMLTKEHYQAGRGYEDGLNQPPIDPFDIKIKSLERETEFETIKGWVDQTEEGKLWLVFVGHRVSDEDLGKYSITPALLRETLGYLKSKNIRVITFEQAIQELSPEFSIIKEGRVVWEFERNLLSEEQHELFVMVNGRRSAAVKF